MFAFTAATAVVLVNLFGPYSTDMATAAYSVSATDAGAAQGVVTGGDFAVSASGESYVSGRTVVAAGAYGPVVVDPGSAQAIARDMLRARGWGDDQFACLFQLWGHESGWRTNAGNPVSGAYGIPQALPASKMASAGPDWASNPATQITWGLGYISGRYGTPCDAWAEWQDKGWY